MEEKKKQKMQTSETFLLSAILAVSGGFQDAYTYNVRGEVFSNAQTGNVVLMSQHFLIRHCIIYSRSWHLPLVCWWQSRSGINTNMPNISTGVRSLL